MLAILLALAASACWGTSDFIGGLQTRRLGIFAVMAGVQAAPLVVIAVIMVIVEPAPPNAGRVLVSVLAGLVGLAGLSALYRALALGPMSVVAPISATGAAVPVIVGIAAGDALSAAQTAGLALAVAGVVVASRAPERDGPRSADAAPRRRWPPPHGVSLAILAALGIGAFLVCAHYGARGGLLWFLTLSRAAALPPLAAVLLLTGAGALPRLRQLPPVLAVAALDGSATALLALANRHGVVSIVSVVGSLYPIVTLLLARSLLAERLTAQQALGVAGALGGVGLISAG